MYRYARVFVAVIAAATLLAIRVSDAEDAVDPVGAQLERARLKYKKEIEQFDNSVKAVLEKKEEAARKAGNKPALNSLQAERELFENDSVLPSVAPLSYGKKRAAIRGDLEQAYELAIKDYTRKRADDEAQKIEVERKDFRNAPVLAATKRTLLGTWSLRVVNGYTTDYIFRADGTAEQTTERFTHPWRIDLDAGFVFIGPEKGGDRIKLPLNEERTAGINPGGMQFFVSKKK